MKLGIIGVGIVGGALKRWFEEHTDHSLALWDPPLNIKQDLSFCDAIFICVPYGGKHKDNILIDSVYLAKKHSKNIFIKSTVLPGTNDSLNTISLPEYLTARRAYQDLSEHPIISGPINKDFLARIFPGKFIMQSSNVECELAKYMHNCFGATKVTYFNMFKKLCDFYGASFDKTKEVANICTGYLGSEHMQVPGHDGKMGYGGTCFGPNMQLIQSHLDLITKNPKIKEDFHLEKEFFSLVRTINLQYRGTEQ